MSKKSRQQQLQREAAAPNPPVTSAPRLVGDMLAPQEHRQALQISSQVTQEVVHWTSPYPPPAILEAYEKIVPGSAQKLVEQAELQTKHRIDLEKTALASDIQRSWAGVICGFVLCLLCIVGGVVCILAGHDAAGGTVATGAVVGLATAFIYGTQTRKAERTERAKMMLGHNPTPDKTSSSEQPAK